MNKLKALVLLGVCGAVLGACGNNETKEDNPTEKASIATESSTEVSSETSESESSETDNPSDVGFKDDVLKIDMATLKILSTEILPPDSAAYRDNNQLVFTYEVTNDSEEGIQASTVWIACFEALQEGSDTINKLDVGMTPQDGKYEEYREHEMDDIKPGGTVKAVIAYDLEDMSTPVVLKATQGIGGEYLGEKTIELK